MKRKIKEVETSNFFVDLPSEIFVEICKWMKHPWDYVQVCIAMNKKPDPKFLWEFFYKYEISTFFEGITLNVRTGRKYGEYEVCYIENHSNLFWTRVYNKSISLRKKHNIFYKQRCGKGLQAHSKYATDGRFEIFPESDKNMWMNGINLSRNQYLEFTSLLQSLEN